jgi:hypothetical protein
MGWKIMQHDRLFSPGIDHTEHSLYAAFLHGVPISHAEDDIQGHTGLVGNFLRAQVETGEQF